MSGTSIPSTSSSKIDSNLQLLLHSLTPHVPLRSIPEELQNCVENLNRECNPLGKPDKDFFLLKDLWNCLEEWSAYGQGTEVTLNDGNTVVQYFAPNLSAIHIFTNKRILKKVSVGNGSENVVVSWSDTSHELMKSSSDKSTHSKFSDSSSGGSSTESSHLPHSGNGPYFEFCASGDPHKREPFCKQITELAGKNPGLLTLKSTDLSPTSWIAIAWYPIYHIPSNVGLHVKDLAAAFITFHTLSSNFYPADSNGIGGSNTKSCSQAMVKEKRDPSMRLPPFGMAALKLTGDVWFNNGESDRNRYNELNKAVVVWLKERCFFHHDFNFFSLKARYHVC